MSDVTKVGPPEPDDLPRKRNGLFERIWRGSWYVGLFNGIMTPLTVFRGADFFKKNAPPEVENPGTAYRKRSLRTNSGVTR